MRKVEGLLLSCRMLCSQSISRNSRFSVRLLTDRRSKGLGCLWAWVSLPKPGRALTERFRQLIVPGGADRHASKHHYVSHGNRWTVPMTDLGQLPSYCAGNDLTHAVTWFSY